MAESTTLLQRARQGEVEAIAILLNQNLRARGFTAQVEAHPQGLRIRLSGDRVPPQAAATTYLRRAFQRLQAPNVPQLVVSGQAPQSDRVAWRAIVPLAPATAGRPAHPSSPEPPPDLAAPTAHWVAPKSELRWFLPLWILLTTLGGWLVQRQWLGFALGAWQRRPGTAELALVLYAAILGLAQWLLLRQYLPKTTAWLPATVFGWLLAALSRSLVAQLLWDSSIRLGFPAAYSANSLGYTLLSGLLVGLWLGAVQTWALWRAGLSMTWWWLVSAIAWTLSAGCTLLLGAIWLRWTVGDTAPSFTALYIARYIFTSGLLNLLGLLVVGGVTGRVLRDRLIRPTPPA